MKPPAITSGAWRIGFVAVLFRSIGKRSHMPSESAAHAFWRRLRSMNGGEIRDRARQEISKRVDLARYFLQLAPHAKIVGHRYTPPQFFFAPQQLPDLAVLLRE